MKLNIVPARTGIQWVKLGVQTFFKQPLALMGLFFMYLAMIAVLWLIPVVGSIAGVMLMPAATLGFMAATAEAAQGRFPLPTVMVSAFRVGRQRARAMLVLGAIYAVLAVAISALASLITGDLPDPTAAGAAAPDPAVAARLLPAMLLYVPVTMLFWHAPALVHWHGVSPVKSLFFSWIACMRNFGALTVYGLVWTGVFVGISLAISVVAAVLGGQSAVNNIAVPTFLLLLAMFSTSLYFTFRDSFRADDDADATNSTGGESKP